MVNLTTLLSGAMGAALVAGTFGLITWALNRRAAKKDKAEAKKAESSEEIANLTCGTRMMLYIAIKDRARHYIHENSITMEDRKDIMAMHEIYHDKLGGNGFLDDIIEQVRHLPTKD